VRLEGRIERIEDLVLKLETGPEANLRGIARELVQALMEFHGAGLERILEILRRRSDADATMDQLAQDELVRSLLLLYGLHPVDVESRVREALDKTRPYLRSHGGNVELLSVEADGSVRLRMQGSCHGCPSSAVTLKLAIEQAIREAAPEVTSIVVVEDEAHERHQPAQLPLVTIEPALRSNGNGQVDGRWETVAGLKELKQDELKVMQVTGRSVLFCRLGDTFFAYADRCPACGADLADGSLTLGALACSACGAAYDVIRAGRGLHRPDLHLEPFPLLLENGRARIALTLQHAGTVVGAGAETT
jgi:Fe-S cluster biogenesis protein NfuA/nitrite reductase/ring-hydroxylating ferredoxin subunit